MYWHYYNLFWENIPFKSQWCIFTTVNISNITLTSNPRKWNKRNNYYAFHSKIFTELIKEKRSFYLVDLLFIYCCKLHPSVDVLLFRWVKVDYSIFIKVLNDLCVAIFSNFLKLETIFTLLKLRVKVEILNL